MSRLQWVPGERRGARVSSQVYALASSPLSCGLKNFVSFALSAVSNRGGLRSALPGGQRWGPLSSV